MSVNFVFIPSFSLADTQSYVLNFHGRVTQASVKNFQIVHDNDGKNSLGSSFETFRPSKWAVLTDFFCKKLLFEWKSSLITLISVYTWVGLGWGGNSTVNS